MRIGIYDPYLDDLGGGEKYMLTIASCLSKQHDVRIFWNEQKDFDQLVQRFPVDINKISLARNIFSPDVSSLQRINITRQYDVLIVLSDGSIPFVLSKKLYLHIQQPLPRIATGWKNKLKLSRVSGIWYNSAFTKSMNEQFFSKIHSSILYPPVAVHEKNVQKENIVLHVGRFRLQHGGSDDYKKQRLMINTFKQMIDDGIKGWKFLLAVSVKEKDMQAFTELEMLAKGYPITFSLNKSNTQLWELYNKAKIYWHASGFGEDLDLYPEYAEHFGISTVEAMGVGVVPVVFNAGGQKEIVTDGKNGFLWDTLEDFQKKTKQVMEDKTLWKKLSEQAKLRAEDFSTEAFCEALYRLLE